MICITLYNQWQSVCFAKNFVLSHKQWVISIYLYIWMRLVLIHSNLKIPLWYVLVHCIYFKVNIGMIIIWHHASLAQVFSSMGTTPGSIFDLPFFDHFSIEEIILLFCFKCLFTLNNKQCNTTNKSSTMKALQVYIHVNLKCTTFHNKHVLIIIALQKDHNIKHLK